MSLTGAWFKVRSLEVQLLLKTKPTLPELAGLELAWPRYRLFPPRSPEWLLRFAGIERGVSDLKISRLQWIRRIFGGLQLGTRQPVHRAGLCLSGW